MHKKKIPADLNHLHEMLEFLSTYVKSRNIDPLLHGKIILATEEALVNVINYGYPSRGENGEVELSCEDTHPRTGIKITIKDQGVPFNPIENTDVPSPTLILDANDESFGGFGISIFVGLMDRVEYQQIPGGNQLTLIKYF